MSADSPDPRIAWLDARYPLPDGWRWDFTRGWRAVLMADGQQAGHIGPLLPDLDGVSTLWIAGSKARQDVVEQVLAVARLDPAEIGRESERLHPDVRSLSIVVWLGDGDGAQLIREATAVVRRHGARALSIHPHVGDESPLKLPPPTPEALARIREEIHRMPLISVDQAPFGVREAMREVGVTGWEPGSGVSSADAIRSVAAERNGARADLEALRQEVERLAFRAAKLAEVADQAGEDAVGLLGRALHEIGLQLQLLEDIAHGSGARQIVVEDEP